MEALCASLPGTPDLVFRRFQAVVFVHGCFWHFHDNCAIGRVPATRTEFWEEKFQRNKERDIRVRMELAGQGWRIFEVWECAMRGKEAMDVGDVAGRVQKWLESGDEFGELRATLSMPT